MTDKGSYDKKIAYLDYLEGGEKVKNAGYVKWEVKNEECRIQIHIRGLYTTDTLQGKVFLLAETDNRVADTLQLQYGAGEYTVRWERGNLAGTGVSYEECRGIRIIISESRCLEALWERKGEGMISPAGMGQENNRIPDERQEIITPPEMFTVSAARIEKVDITIAAKETEKEAEPGINVVQESSREAEPGINVVQESNREAEPGINVMQESSREAESDINTMRENARIEKPDINFVPDSRRLTKPERFSGDKWVQLNRIYPHIRPFGDKREYLSIGPGDFVVLTRRYQNLVQNSFLLHGYYNYGHVILTRIREKDEDIFYLGVPGVYYDREKQAALMFGFEGFESGVETAGEGGFGYYMKRVDI